jgi:hypothetical protein
MSLFICCRWRLAPICWLDNLNHLLGLEWRRLCDLHDRLIMGEGA